MTWACRPAARAEGGSRAVSFLVSDDGAWITGQILYVDGGYSGSGGAHYRLCEAQALWDRVNRPLGTFMEKAAQRSGGYRVGKAMAALMGHPMGEPRPPTLPLDAQEMAELRDLMIGFGWPVPADLTLTC